MQFLRLRGLVQSRTETQNGQEQVIAYAPVMSLSFAMVAASSREFWEYRRTHPKITRELVCRYTTAIREQMRIVCGQRVFLIGGVVDVEGKHRELRLFCEEIVQ